ncbi:MAG: ATP synthase F1 subunit epsilon [Acidobacteriota bacterium]|jgi:F-type H+-transporting ATPase subunit epsilon
MADRLRLEVVTPRSRILECEADEVRLPGALGELGVLPGHTPLLTSLGTGRLLWIDRQGVGRLAVQGGFAEVLPNAVTVLATVAEKPEEIDLEMTRAALAEAESALKTASADELDELTATLRLAETRIKVATGDDA